MAKIIISFDIIFIYNIIFNDSAAMEFIIEIGVAPPELEHG